MIPILATKLYLPQLRPNVVLRPHLCERLSAGLYRKLTLLSAPAGFGKTTLLSEWLAEAGRPAAWLSLDEGENDPIRFLTYLVGAVQTITAMPGEEVLGALQSSQPLSTEALLTALLNYLTAIHDPFILVLDDYHVIDARPVDLILAYLVEHLPPQMHLVIATREDPPLPLARLRARDQLTEIRAADLRFAFSEVTAFLNQRMGLSLSEADIARLSDRTEGWIAGLQLAALSMQGHQDVSGLIRTFAGDHRYIMDYLVEEVLQRQPDAVRNFLLQTAILDRLSGSLCDAVIGQEGSSVLLETLERNNFFVHPLDDKRHWYRYHHLFAEVLSALLLAEQPDQIATLHRRASEWYEQNGMEADAVRHALVTREFKRVADLVEQALPAIRRHRQEATLLSWLKALPDELVRARPLLSVGYSWALLARGELEAAQARLQDAEQWLDMAAGTREHALAPSLTMDEEELRYLQGSIAVYRAAYAQALGNVSDTVKYARQVLDLLPNEDHLGRGAAVALLGLAFWISGDLEAAYCTFADGMERVRMAGNFSDFISGTIALADIRVAQGRLREAMRVYERSVRLVAEAGEPTLRGTADLYVGMSELYWERNDLEVAIQYLQKSKETAERVGTPYNRSRWYAAKARISEAQGDLDGALDLLYEAERLYQRDFFPDVHPAAALRARVWIAQERSDEAFAWAREQGLGVADNLSYLHEFEHITLVRVILAQYRSGQASGSMLGTAMGFLERLLQAAQAGKRTGSVIEIQMLRALALQMQGDIHAALVPLHQALTLAEPEGYVRMFVGEGLSVMILLKEATKYGIALNYVRQLLAIMAAPENETAIKQDIIEPLSERELEVLRLLATDLSGPEIARELVVSLNTMRTHTKSIYTRLGVNSRLSAIRRAQELNLFS